MRNSFYSDVPSPQSVSIDSSSKHDVRIGITFSDSHVVDVGEVKRGNQLRVSLVFSANIENHDSSILDSVGGRVVRESTAHSAHIEIRPVIFDVAIVAKVEEGGQLVDEKWLIRIVETHYGEPLRRLVVGESLLLLSVKFTITVSPWSSKFFSIVPLLSPMRTPGMVSPIEEPVIPGYTTLSS